MKASAACLLAVAAAWFMLAPATRAQTDAAFTSLYDLGTYDGSESFGLVQGSDGNLYGTAKFAGSNAKGTIFRVSPAGVFTVLYTFNSTGSSDVNRDGAEPFGPPVESSDGSFYGTASEGGSGGTGTVYRLTTAGALTTLYEFSATSTLVNSDGVSPGPLLLGKDGNFYGTAYYGGSGGNGTVFEVTPAGAFTTLYSFGTNDGDGTNPSSLVQGIDGNFYGVTSGGGSGDNGTVFQVTREGTFNTLHSFSADSSDGAGPSSLVQGSDGNLYGTTAQGGSNGSGTVFKITAAGEFTTLYAFDDTTSDGEGPSGLVQGGDGNLYGTTGSDDINASTGTVFQITPAGALTTLHTFNDFTNQSINEDGANPSGLVQGSDGSIYGTTQFGGSNGDGTVFRLMVAGTAPAHPAFFTGEVSLGSGVYYLAFQNGNPFGYYGFLSDSHYIYHFDLGYEYVFDAADGKGGVYLYDFASSTFFYTSPFFPFPYLYDFNLNTVLYYYPDPNNAGHYNTDGVRYFYDFDTDQIISK